jgi:hypothetical protein
MKRVRIACPWFSAVVTVRADGVIQSVESCSADSLIDWSTDALKGNLERAAVSTGWGRSAVSFEQLTETVK